MQWDFEYSSEIQSAVHGIFSNSNTIKKERKYTVRKACQHDWNTNTQFNGGNSENRPEFEILFITLYLKAQLFWLNGVNITFASELLEIVMIFSQQMLESDWSIIAATWK